MAKYLDENGLAYFWQKIKAVLAPLASPAFTGTPTAPTPISSDDSTKIATTAFVQDVVGGVGDTTYTLTKSGSTITLTGSDGSTTSVTDDNTTYGLFGKNANGLVPMTGNTRAEDNILVSYNGGLWMTLAEHLDDVYKPSSLNSGFFKRFYIDSGTSISEGWVLAEINASDITSGTFATARIPNLSASKITSGTLDVARGGTGVGTLTGIVKGNGTSAMSAATASDVVTLLGTTAVNRATADASGNNIASTYATKAEVTGALIYQGTAISNSDLGTTYKKGNYWVVGSGGGTIAGQTVEAGDMVIAHADYSGTIANDVDVVQANIIAITNAEIDTIMAS